MKSVLHQRIIDNCWTLYKQGHFKHAALEAMIQVELALKEKTIAPRELFGVRLVKRAFKEGRHIMLAVKLGLEYQKNAEMLFEGAFSYYRNYAAHDGSLIDQKICLRVLVLASELLDLLAASARVLPSARGVKGLIEDGIFDSEQSFAKCLKFFDDYVVSEDVFDGYFEDLAYADISESQEQLLFELGLVETRTEYTNGNPDYEFITIFSLTKLGKSLLEEIESSVLQTKKQSHVESIS